MLAGGGTSSSATNITLLQVKTQASWAASQAFEEYLEEGYQAKLVWLGIVCEDNIDGSIWSLKACKQ
ncbi:hypothetical protein SUGI_0233470 [Cryptomeria japonica]|nr:hypothetical protein SUGI_0233470 [Cryptomeria japonica]